MKSSFDKQTSEGLYTFDQDDIFEALTMWCAQKGIVLDKTSVKHYDSTATVEIENGKQTGFIVEIAFNHLQRKVG